MQCPNETISMSKILVSDFDGVICNGLSEYFHSSTLVYRQIWTSPTDLSLFQENFFLSRPVVETGWEMPLLIRAFVEGETTENILSDWRSIKAKILDNLEAQGIIKNELIQLLDQVRKKQISENLDRWLQLHSFYDGIINKLHNLLQQNIPLYIITTKEGSFTRTLLEQQGISLPEQCIFGKEVKRPKYETLRMIIAQESITPNQVVFIEDRLEALTLVAQQKDLQEVQLYLADWGYNTLATQGQAQKSSSVQLLSLANFTGNDVF